MAAKADLLIDIESTTGESTMPSTVKVCAPVCSKVSSSDVPSAQSFSSAMLTGTTNPVSLGVMVPSTLSMSKRSWKLSSIPLTKFSVPSRITAPSCSRLASATSGRATAVSPKLVGNPEKLNWSALVAMTSPLTPPVNTSSMVSRTEAVSTVTSVMRAIPIMIAAAVAVVRRGLRPALRCASRPGTPWSRASGAPRSRVTGSAMKALST